MKPEDQNPKIINNMNYVLKEKHMRHGSTVSLTVPDQTMSIRTLIQRYAQGLPVMGAAGQPQYDPEPLLDGVNFKTLDLSEQQEIQKNVLEELQAIEKRKMDKETEKKQKALESKIRQQIEAESKREPNPEPPKP